MNAPPSRETIAELVAIEAARAKVANDVEEHAAKVANRLEHIEPGTLGEAGVRYFDGLLSLYATLSGALLDVRTIIADPFRLAREYLKANGHDGGKAP